MDDVFFDPLGEVAWQSTDPDITGATDDELEAALRDLFDQIAGDAADTKLHDRASRLCERAGSDACKALGHTFDDFEESWMPLDDHPLGWDNDAICWQTRAGTACSWCESEDCPATRLDVHLWALPGVRA